MAGHALDVIFDDQASMYYDHHGLPLHLLLSERQNTKV